MGHLKVKIKRHITKVYVNTKIDKIKIPEQMSLRTIFQIIIECTEATN